MHTHVHACIHIRTGPVTVTGRVTVVATEAAVIVKGPVSAIGPKIGPVTVKGSMT